MLTKKYSIPNLEFDFTALNTNVLWSKLNPNSRLAIKFKLIL